MLHSRGAASGAKGKPTEDDRESRQRQREHPEPAKEDGAPEIGSCVREGDVRRRGGRRDLRRALFRIRHRESRQDNLRTSSH